MESITIRHSGMFRPGQSGNPSGRPKLDRTIQELAKAYTQDAIETLVEVAKNPNASDSARVQAASAILDRGWGKPVQTNENINANLNYYDFLAQIVESEEFKQIEKQTDRLFE